MTENKPGATGNIGAELVAKAPADGVTLLVAATSFATNPVLSPAPYDPVKSFAPVIVAATSALGVLVNPQVPALSMRELIETARRQPGKLHYGSPGNGGVQHLAMELIKLEAGIDLVHVPVQGPGRHARRPGRRPRAGGGVGAAVGGAARAVGPAAHARR